MVVRPLIMESWKLSAFNTRTSLDQHLFVRTHVAAYFISLLVCDLIQGVYYSSYLSDIATGTNDPSAIASITNTSWIKLMGVRAGDICVLQGQYVVLDRQSNFTDHSIPGALKQTSDIGIAVWTLVSHYPFALTPELTVPKGYCWSHLLPLVFRT